MTTELYRARRAELVEVLERVDAGELVRVWNETIVEDNPDEMIYSMDEFDEIFRDEQPSRLACMIQFGDFNYNHDWFKFNGYGNIITSDHVSELICLDELADYIIDNRNSYDIDDIAELLDEWQADDEKPEE